MARARKAKPGSILLDFGEANAKQQLFLNSEVRYTAYGGARGGGKTHILIRKAVGMALNYAGIKIVVVRKTYPDLEEGVRMPMMAFINSARDSKGEPAGERIAYYNGSTRILTFQNGSLILFRHLSGDDDLNEFQGKEYDVIFMDEATQFTEYQFRVLGATLRGVNKFPKRFYLTCNPGGVGHQWVKRLFITREFKKDSYDRQGRKIPGENPKDYYFIPATVEDNTHLMESNPEYIAMLDNMPEDMRAAHRFGDWDALAGGFFPEFKPETHVCKPFVIPDNWPRYRAFDYGLDMLACLWFAVDETGRVWVYREYCESRLIVSEAAEAIRRLTPQGEFIEFTAAPPDMWSTVKDNHKTMAELFAENGVPIVKASNQRVQGWMAVKEVMAMRADGKPGIQFFEGMCPRCMSDIPAIQHDDKNPSDCAKEPHEITHVNDALRYGMVSRMLCAEIVQTADEEEEDETNVDYQTFMCGGSPTASYLAYTGRAG